MSKKTICVIGSSGTVGSAISEELVELGYTVYGISKTGYNKFRHVSSAESITKKGNILNLENLLDFTSRADLVICAFKPSNYNLSSWREEYPILINNIIALAKLGKAVIFIDSIESYGNTEGETISEVTPYKPATEYTQIKAYIRQTLEKAMADADFPDLPITILQASVMFGPYANKSILGEHFFTQLLSPKQSVINIIPNQDLPFSFTYTRDLATATAAIVENKNNLNFNGQVILIPSMKQISVPGLARQIVEEIKSIAKISVMPSWKLRLQAWLNNDILVLKDSQYLHNYPLQIDSSKFKKYFPNWSQTSNQDAIIETIKWYKKYEN